MSSPESGNKTWPASLDLREWLAFSLGETDEISRRMALEEFAANGLPRKFFPRVEEIAAADSSVVCRDLAANILYLEGKKEEFEKLSGHFETTPQSFRELFDQAESPFRKALLKVAWKVSSPELLDIWRDQLLSEEIAEILAIGLSLLAQAGRPSDTGLAVSFLGHDAPEVVQAAIDLLFHQDRQMLKNHLAGALAHDNLDIRFHAIRRLAAIDLPEALNFLNHAIEGDEPLVRRRSIQELSLLPLQEAEPSYIRVMGLETQPLLLVMAGSALVARPKIDLPPHIYDTLMMSKGIKRHILEIILRQVVAGIKAAGILTVSPEEYLETLQRELQSRRADLATALAIRDLRHPEPEIRRQALEKLQPLAHEARVQKAFRTRARIETDPEIKSRIAALVAEDEKPAAPPVVEVAPATTTTLDQEVRSEQFFQLPLPKQIALLATVKNRDQFSEVRRSLLKILEKSAERSVISKCLKVFETFGTAPDVDSLLPLLKNPDPLVIGNTLKTISRLDFDKIATILNPLLRDENLAIKAAALEVYVNCDKDGALQFLKSMLLSPVAAVRRKALSIAPLLDYPSIEPLLLSIIRKDPHLDIQSQAGFLIASNPTDAGLKALFLHTHSAKGLPGNDLNELWETARPTAATFFSKPPETVDAWLESQVVKEPDGKAGDSPDYTFKKVVQKDSAGSGVFSLPATDWEALLKSREMLGITVFAVLFSVFSLIENPPWPPPRSYRREIIAAVQENPSSQKGSSTQISGAAAANNEAWVLVNGTWKTDLASPSLVIPEKSPGK